MKKRYVLHTITGKLFLQLLLIFGCLLCLISLSVKRMTEEDGGLPPGIPDAHRH